MKNILSLEGIKILGKEVQKTVNGGRNNSCNCDTIDDQFFQEYCGCD